MSSGIITLLTDFGLEDSYVGVMKGVILGLNPGAAIVDLTHQIKQGDIHQAAHVLQQSCSFFPSGAIHVAVVDPGVGTSRKPILVKSRSQFFVGPDNGLFWPIIKADPQVLIIHLKTRKFFLPYISHTFHGRDIFAPVAGHLSLGIDPLKMGLLMENAVSIADMSPTQKGNTLFGRAVRIDHFGNVVTNIHREELARFLGNRRMVVRVAQKKIDRLLKTYAEGEHGKLMVLFGSTGHLEIAVNSGRADSHLNLGEMHRLPMVKVDRVDP